MKFNEESLQKAVCDYIRAQYPTAIFNSDLSGIKLTIGQAAKVKGLRSSNGFPDIVIYERRGNYSALFIELKRDGEKIKLYSKDEYVSEHVKEQARMHEKLNKLGYLARFCVGFDNAKTLIDSYMRLPKPYEV